MAFIFACSIAVFDNLDLTRTSCCPQPAAFQESPDPPCAVGLLVSCSFEQIYLTAK